MDNPPQKNEPKESGKNELHNRHEEPALKQLAKPGNEEAAERRNHVAG